MKDKTYIIAGMMLSEFKSQVESFLKETGMSPSCLGRNALKDPNFVFGLRQGAEPRESTRLKVLKKMQELRRAHEPPS